MIDQFLPGKDLLPEIKDWEVFPDQGANQLFLSNKRLTSTPVESLLKYAGANLRVQGDLETYRQYKRGYCPKRDDWRLPSDEVLTHLTAYSPNPGNLAMEIKRVFGLFPSDIVRFTEYEIKWESIYSDHILSDLEKFCLDEGIEYDPSGDEEEELTYIPFDKGKQEIQPSPVLCIDYTNIVTRFQSLRSIEIINIPTTCNRDHFAQDELRRLEIDLKPFECQHCWVLEAENFVKFFSHYKREELNESEAMIKNAISKMAYENREKYFTEVQQELEEEEGDFLMEGW